MSILSAISSQSTGSYTRTRTALGTTNSSGVFVPGATSTATIVASVQPVAVRRVAGALLKALPEGRSVEDIRSVHTASDLRVAPVPDRLTIDGAEFELFLVEKWQGRGQTYYRGYASRVATGSGTAP